MKERPILFSGPMVRAILDGRKTQTRRVVTPSRYMLRYTEERHGGFSSLAQANEAAASAARSHLAMGNTERLPYGHPGDRLYVRETHALVPRTAYAQSDGVQQTLNPLDNHDAAIYREGWERSQGGLRWRPSIHMPRWASRITLEVTAVRVERVQEITAADCIAEGIPSRGVDRDGACIASAIMYIGDYETLWNRLNAKRGYGWDVNPWVWVIEFKRLTESVEAAA